MNLKKMGKKKWNIEGGDPLQNSDENAEEKNKTSEKEK